MESTQGDTDLQMTDQKKSEGQVKAVMELSVIIPITERCDDIDEIYRDYRSALDGLNISYEMIIVVDGEFNEEYEYLKKLKQEKDDPITIIKLSKSFGEATAISEGYKHSRGKLILTLPSYFQVTLENINDLFASVNECDLVSVRRWPRNDSSLNQVQTRYFHRIVKMITGVDVKDIGCSVRLFHRRVLEEVPLYGDLHRFIPILADKRGFKVREVCLEQSLKEKRVRTYSPGQYLRRIIDLVTVFFLVKFAGKPLRFFGLAGISILVPGFVITFAMIIGRVAGVSGLSDRPLFLLGILLVVLGIQVFAIGLIGEIIIFSHARDIKDYTIEKIIN
jgi:glycosyltransferase involved in cell wall biosynthesis